MAFVNWPWSPAEVVCLNQENNDLQISHVFELYIEDINNWSLNPAVLDMFPTLVDKAWIKPSHDATTASSSSFVF